MNNGDMPAMPTFVAPSLDGGLHEGFHGLTKREHFAAKAMQGLLSDDGVERFAYEDLASAAVSFADALLAALEKTA